MEDCGHVTRKRGDDNRNSDFETESQKSRWINHSWIGVLKLPQTGHVVTVALALCACAAWFSSTNEDAEEERKRGFWTTFFYFGSFAAHFGAQIWMTFVSGIALFFSIPRSHFAEVQQILFPKYFLMNAVLGLVTLVTFAKSHVTLLQVFVLSTCSLTEMVTWLFIVPPLLEALRTRNALEVEAGLGAEVGRADAHAQRMLLERCPRYGTLHSRFRKCHGACAVTNMLALACNVVHLYHVTVVHGACADLVAT